MNVIYTESVLFYVAPRIQGVEGKERCVTPRPTLEVYMGILDT